MSRETPSICVICETYPPVVEPSSFYRVSKWLISLLRCFPVCGPKCRPALFGIQVSRTARDGQQER